MFGNIQALLQVTITLKLERPTRGIEESHGLGRRRFLLLPECRVSLTINQANTSMLSIRTSEIDSFHHSS